MNEYDLATAGKLAPALQKLLQTLKAKDPDHLNRDTVAAAERLRELGATFPLTSEPNCDGILPFDPLPRLISHAEWTRLSTGLTQRLRAIEAFIRDVYGRQLIVRDGVLPLELLESSPYWLPFLRDWQPPGGHWCVIAALDLIRDDQGDWLVLEDNLRRGSGLGYALTARRVHQERLSWLQEGQRIQSIAEVPHHLISTLRRLATKSDDPQVILLSPGRSSSAFHDHLTLGEAMGIEIVESKDLHCDGGRVWQNSPQGIKPVDVIYRRNDDFIAFRSNETPQLLGIPGLLDAYREGAVVIANAPGVGIGGDKLLYSYLPSMVRFYLGEEPLLPQVPTLACIDPQQQNQVLNQIEQLVVKQVDGAGGEGILIGNQASADERQRMVDQIRAQPRRYIAQPIIQLSTVPTLIDGEWHDCAVDLRPFSVCDGDEPKVLAGALTRVARPAGSLVVNSSRGGGYKDTWIVKNPILEL